MDGHPKRTDENGQAEKTVEGHVSSSFRLGSVNKWKNFTFDLTRERDMESDEGRFFR